MRKLARDAGLELYAEIDAAGKNTIDAEIAGYNLAAQGSPWFILRDPDQDARYAAEFFSRQGLVCLHNGCAPVSRFAGKKIFQT
ncbi:MAG: hypothetical protein ABJC13_17225 [Acidobacteriota bacterium]